MGDTFDIVILGAGPGGYVAAIRAAQLGLRTAIIERSHLGGICLNWGCIPTKALLKIGELYESLSHLEEYGLSVEGAKFDFEKIIQRSRDTANKLSAGVAFLMRKNKIEVIEGNGYLQKAPGAPAILVDLKEGGQRIVSAKAVIVATGARPRLISELGMVPDGVRVWTYREAMFPKAAPDSLVVIGSGAIGSEFASFYRALGCNVVVVEAMERILPIEDEEVSAAARKAFEKRGLKFKVGAKVTRLVKDDSGVQVELVIGDKVETLKADVAIIAIGIDGNVEGFGLEELGVKVDRGHIVTDNHGATKVPGLYAVGDVAGPPWLAHKASHEAVHCVEHIAGLKTPSIKSPIPACTYTQPQIASVGLTETQAKRQNREIKVGKYLFRNNGKAIALGDTDGFVKTIFDAKTGELLGAHLIGPDVTEMIQGFAIAMTLETTEAELMATVFPHPTLSEAMHEATLDAYRIALNA